MDIEIIGVREKGNKDKERIVLKALSDIDLGFFMILFTSKIETEKFSSVPDNMYWFPYREIKKGDLIILYSKKGKSTERENTEITSYFFYAGLETSFFADDNKTAVLLDINAWSAIN